MTKEERKALLVSRVGATNIRKIALTRKTGGSKGTGSGGHRPWTQREDAILKRQDLSIMEMVELTGRSYKAVDCRRNKLPGARIFKSPRGVR